MQFNRKGTSADRTSHPVSFPAVPGAQNDRQF